MLSFSLRTPIHPTGSRITAPHGSAHPGSRTRCPSITSPAADRRPQQEEYE
ncbi:hypothetical protein [Streptomyces eurythermus]|uniref:hypothetical protein n=1 Tax=Streptomyces eurythermus TaxID=42237 RepID=UPI003701C0D7